jgi:hypothetical protein
VKQIGFVLQYNKGQNLVAIETFKRRRRKTKNSQPYAKDCRKRFTTPEGQGHTFNEFLKSLKYGDRIVISKYEDTSPKCGLCQEKLGFDDKVRYTKVDDKEEPVHEECYDDMWDEAHEELENKFDSEESQ